MVGAEMLGQEAEYGRRRGADHGRDHQRAEILQLIDRRVRGKAHAIEFERADRGLQLVQRNETGEAADQHHALDPEVDHARLLHHQFTDGGEQQRRGEQHRGCEDLDDQLTHDAVLSLSSAWVPKTTR